MDNSTLNLMEVIAVAEAGMYVLKGLGYQWLKFRSQYLPTLEMQQRGEGTLRLARTGFSLPTPIDIFYLTRGLIKLMKNDSYRGSVIQHPETGFPEPYSRGPRILDLVDTTKVSDSQLFEFHGQQLNLAE